MLSYLDGYRNVTVFTHADLIVLPYWETRPPSMTQYLILLGYSYTDLTRPYHILVMPNIGLGSNKCQLCTSLNWHSWKSTFRSSAREACTLPTGPPHAVKAGGWSSFVGSCSRQHVMSYQGGNRLVTVITHGDFIVLLHGETWPPVNDMVFHLVIVSLHWVCPF